MFIRALSFICVICVGIQCANCIDFASFINVLQGLSDRAKNHKLNTVLAKPGVSRDILDSMMVFVKTALEHDPSLVEKSIEELGFNDDELIKAAIFKPISLMPDYSHRTLDLLHDKDFGAFYRKAKSINYRFVEIKYPEHLMLCFKATGKPEYLERLTNYLDFDDSESSEIARVHDVHAMDAEHQLLLQRYTFYLETKHILAAEVFYPGVRECLTNIADNSDSAPIRQRLGEILNSGIGN